MLEGKRIRLRAIERLDLSILRKWLNDFRLRGVYSGGFNPLSLDQFETESSYKNLNEKVLVLAIVLKENDELIGTVNYRIEKFNTGRLGIVFGRVKYRRKGYGTEAVLLMMRICFLEKNFQKLILSTRSWNLPAQKLAESLGFKQAVRLRHVVQREGKWYDVIIYDLLKEEYLELYGND